MCLATCCSSDNWMMRYFENTLIKVILLDAVQALSLKPCLAQCRRAGHDTTVHVLLEFATDMVILSQIRLSPAAVQVLRRPCNRVPAAIACRHAAGECGPSSLCAEASSATVPGQ